MTGLTKAVSAYIAEHGSIDSETYDHLAEIYTSEGGTSSAATMDLRVLDAVLPALDKAISSKDKVNDPKLRSLLEQIEKLRNKVRSRKDDLDDVAGNVH